jgi:mannosyltransferase OCH1-like enzyme
MENFDECSKNINETFSCLGNIEKKIHISWKNKDVLDKDYNIIKNGILQLKNLNPDYEFNIYDDDDIENYLKIKLSHEDYELIKNKKIVEKTDLWRLFLIYDEGGIYQDIDRFCNIPLSSIIKPTTKCLLPMYYDTDFSQDIMCSSSKNIIYKRAIELNLERRRGNVSDDILYFGPHTYFHAVTEILLGYQLNRNPDKKDVELLRNLINESPYLETYREDPPYNTILYQGENIIFDKGELYESYGVRIWYTY